MKMQMMIRFVWKSKHNGCLKHHCIVLRYMIFMGFVIANSYEEVSFYTGAFFIGN